MGWFDVAKASNGRSYSVSTRPTGMNMAFRPSAASRVPLVAANYLSPFGLVGILLNRAFFRGSWCVTVAPWNGRRGERWKVQVATETESDRRAEDLFQLINTGQWNPEVEPPPSPAP